MLLRWFAPYGRNLLAPHYDSPKKTLSTTLSDDGRVFAFLAGGEFTIPLLALLLCLGVIAVHPALVHGDEPRLKTLSGFGLTVAKFPLLPRFGGFFEWV